jgi:hypothetical protein
MKRVDRRDFFKSFAAPSPKPVTPPPAGSSSGFSLTDFYAARAPQKLPPIVIRPSVLHYASQLTAVGCPPAHDPPALEGDLLYAHLSAELATESAEDHHDLEETTEPSSLPRTNSPGSNSRRLV